MDLQLDDIAWADSQFTKRQAGPIFVSSEADKIFVLTAHLKGYGRRNIKLDINKDGNCIAIYGEKTIQETVMMGSQVYNKGVQIKRFRKAFKIPDGIILDEISARFNDIESVLTITMPKKVIGICGIGIEEVQEHVSARAGSGTLQIVDDEKFQVGSSKKNPKQNGEETKRDFNQLTQKGNSPSLISRNEHEWLHGFDKQDIKTQDNSNQLYSEKMADLNQDRHDHGSQGKTYDSKEQVEKEFASVEEAKEIQESELSKNDEAKMPKRRCTILVAGSAILVSLVVFSYHMIKKKNQANKSGI